MSFDNVNESLQSKIRGFVEKTPQKVAIEYKDERYTYLEMEKKSNYMAKYLLEKTKENKKIVLLMDKGPSLVLSILGVLKCGGIFIPIDTRLPENRLKTMLDEIEAGLIITEFQYLKKLNEVMKTNKKILSVIIDDSYKVNPEDYPYLNINVISSNTSNETIEEVDVFSDICYIYFTSGSTGKPKGVLGSHKSLKHFIDWEIRKLGVDESFRVSQLTAPTFDPFLRDIFVPLCSGATVCIPEEADIILNPENLIKWINDKKISLVHMVPTLFRSIMSELESSANFYSLKFILLAGEMLKGVDIKKFYELFKDRIQLVNLYGPSETTLAKAFHFIDKDEINRINIPIGKPIDDTKLLILDKEMNLCNKGNVGEICIDTQYMSLGYYNNNELTTRSFVKYYFGESDIRIIYKTGDLGVMLPDGNIECLGRIDNQVKIRGVRIELTEIEKYIIESGLVTETAAVVKESQDGEKHICVFLTKNENLDISQLRKYLINQLPVYMIPSYFTAIDSMPLLPNGKVNRKLLSEYDIELSTGVEYETPESQVEKELAQLWSEVLSIKRIGINDNFFLLGGHSLKAAKLSRKIHKHFNVNIAIKDILINNTIKTMAKYIENCSQSTYSSIPLVEVREYYPTSSAQKRIYLTSMIENSRTAYNIPQALLIEGALDRNKVNSAFQKMLQRQESLRTAFKLLDDGLMQHIHEDINFEIEYKELDVNKGTEQIIEQILKNFIQPFDLNKAPLFRACLVKVSENKHILLRDMHHIVSDGISEEILNEEFAKLYNGQELSELKLQYKDFSQWQNDLLKSEFIKKQEEYWLSNLSGELPVLNIPTDYIRPPRKSFSGDCITFEIDKELLKAINKASVDNEATLYMVLLAAFNVLLLKYTNQEDFIVGTPIAGRNHADLENVVGVFINTLAMRNYPQNDDTFKIFLEKVKNNTLLAFDNQEYQFENLIEKLNLERDLSRNPLFDVMFILQNMDFAEMSINKFKIESQKIVRDVSKFDLTLTAVQLEDKLEISFEYCTELFKKETIKRLASHYINILKIATENTEVKLSDIDMLSMEEKEEVLYKFNNTETKYESQRMVHELFEEQVQKNPEKTALIFGNKTLTYSQLNINANMLAEKLRQKGVTTDKMVGLMVPRSLEMLIGILGVLKAGGAYLPIDPTYPEERVRYMLENSKCEIVLTQPMENDIDLPMESINLLDDSSYVGSGLNSDSTGNSNSLAYVIYTSGSTGKPKGVMIAHRNINNFIKGMTDRIDFSSNKTILCLTTISFDIFVLETLLPLTKGLTIVIANEQQQMDPDMLSIIIEENKVDMLQITPSRLQMLLQSKNANACLRNVKEVIIGGEAFPAKLLEELKALENTKIFNVYGPTEATVWSTVKDLTKEETINIGKPIANTQIYITDKFGSAQPIGIPGELHITGDGLARGYLNRQDLTDERFVANPFIKGKLMYKTGDLARWLPNGDIEFLGRADDQVKLRGYRIELAEIEKCITGYEGIENCVCVVRKDKHDIVYLAAYYVSSMEISISEIRNYLLKFLPDYMIPQAYMRLDKIPMTPNGKVARKALPDIDITRPKLETEYSVGKTNAEKAISSIWSSLLQREFVGIYDNFFELGGNSLLLVMMHKEIEKQYPGKVTIADIFANPTVSKLSKFIEREEGNTQKIDLNPLELPKEFFITEDVSNEDTVFEYVLDTSLCEKIRLIADNNKLHTSNILLASYAYLLAEITNKETLPIQIVKDSRSAAQLDIDLSMISDFNSLFETVRIAYEKSLLNVYEITTLNNIRGIKEGNLGIAAFVDNVNISSRLISVWDLILKVDESSEAIKFIFEYNAARIRASKAEELLQWYIKLINLIISKILF
ncbi:MAG: amino acid adenylation domain-containing protein [Bacillota bacterium]|nr:amino acid adenylation domain-containing protein [Bacillota bacterium]